ncbi:MAG TPA: hypothetical protein VJV04_04080 [Nitrospiraceae bacterium]|nr:hypothetical protein [Nitrospiraceae bacterium]
MNQDQWNGGMKELKGILKKRWGKLTRNSLLEAMGELERLLGVFQRQYGYLKARELRENRQDVPHVPPDWTGQERSSFVLIHGNKRSRHASHRIRSSSPRLELS